MSIFSKIFGDPNEKELKKLQFLVEKINSLEPEAEKLTGEKLKNKTQEFKERLAKGENLDDLLPEAFACVREAAKRTLGMRHFDVQILGGIVLHQGKIAEMKTGEGKTLVATLSLYLNALEGKGAHLVTVNDYLAKRDAQWMGPIYEALGMNVGVIQNLGISYLYQKKEEKKKEEEDLVPCSRRDAYLADITYGTNNEFGFDYLRDNMAPSLEYLSQRELNFAIVDEVDSILIDEARTPLIISAPAEESASLYQRFAQIVPRLKEKEDYVVDEKMRAVSITDEGIEKIEKSLGMDNIYSPENIHLVHHLEEALRASVLFKKDRDYVVKGGEVIIVDEFTGRLMPGRRYSEGLHQAIEAKEGVEVKRESDTLATISFQNLFRLYKKLAGMTGTALTEAEEFYKIYNLEVLTVPTHRPMIRTDMEDQIYKSGEGKFKAVVENIKERHDQGQPVLVGTISIEKSEKLSRMLKREGIKHEVLNAKHHEREAKIIAQAGRPGQVTVATNMAGRGVDIILGGNPPKPEDREKVLEVEGLHILGTERHEARRIDNQLRGRSGRQGDPGTSQFYVSMEDDLMRIFGGERMKNLMGRLGLPDDQPIEHRLISRSIEQAQKRVEGYNFDLRKHLVEYDDVMNKHREVIYRKRRKILELEPQKENWLHQEISEILEGEERKKLEEKEEEFGKENFYQVEKAVYLRVIDTLWVEHLNSIDELRGSIGLRGYGQQDPLVVYKQEAFAMFERLIRAIESQVIEVLLHLEAAPPQVVSPIRQMALRGASEELAGGAIHSPVTTAPTLSPQPKVDEVTPISTPSQPAADSGVEVIVRKAGDSISQPTTVVGPTQTVTAIPKVGRNDPCPCGAKKPDGRPVKYKHCHGR